MIEKIRIRQPIIISPEEYEEWLMPSERPPVHLLRVLPQEQMSMALINPPLASKALDESLMKGLFD